MNDATPTANACESNRRGLPSRTYETLGAHTVADGSRWRFACFAPFAKQASLVGDFNGWDRTVNRMRRNADGVWEIELDNVLGDAPQGAAVRYRFDVCGFEDRWRLKNDPYAFAYADSQSCLALPARFRWNDDAWMRARSGDCPTLRPVNVCRVAWDAARQRENRSFFAELAESFAPVAAEQGYTHIALMPVMERSEACGECLTGFYSTDERLGTPEELMELIDQCHRLDLGVLLEWSPFFFADDEAGLRLFDGTELYEAYQCVDASRAYHRFDLASRIACSFLLDNARFWLEHYHADGLLVKGLRDAWAGRDPALAAFLRRLNDMAHHSFPGAMMIADDSAACATVTTPSQIGGLGFDFALDTGWADDLRDYSDTDSFYRRYRHDRLTSRLRVDRGVNAMLPVAEPTKPVEVSASQTFDLWRHFAEIRARIGYAMACPGKKLAACSEPIGQSNAAWKGAPIACERARQLRQCMNELNRFYRATPALYRADDLRRGFRWITEDDVDNSVVAFLRLDGAGRALLCVVNFTPAFHPIYRVGLPERGALTEVFNTDCAAYGGSDQRNAFPIEAEELGWNELPYSANLCVPPLSCVYFEYIVDSRKVRRTARIGTPSQGFSQMRRR